MQTNEEDTKKNLASKDDEITDLKSKIEVLQNQHSDANSVSEKLQTEVISNE